MARACLRAGEPRLRHAGRPPPRGGDGVVFRHPELVSPRGAHAFRRAEAAAEFGCRHGDAAGAAPFGRADEPARPHRRGGVPLRTGAGEPRARHDRVADGAPAGGGAAPRVARARARRRRAALRRSARGGRRGAPRTRPRALFRHADGDARLGGGGERAALPRNGAGGQGVAARLRRSASALAAAAGAAAPRGRDRALGGGAMVPL